MTSEENAQVEDKVEKSTEADSTGAQEEQADSTETEQADEAETSSESPSEEQPAEDKEESGSGEGQEAELPEKYQGKSAGEIAQMHQELEKKLGNYQEVEEKAAAFDQLSQAPARPVSPPQAQDFVNEQGEIDLDAYQKAQDNYTTYLARENAETSRRVTREEIDKTRVEQEFPEIKENDTLAKTIVGLYRSGATPSLYEAAKEVAKLRTQESDKGKREGAALKEREIAKKIGSQTEKAAGTITDSISEEEFAKLSLPEKRAFVNRLVTEQENK